MDAARGVLPEPKHVGRACVMMVDGARSVDVATLPVIMAAEGGM